MITVFDPRVVAVPTILDAKLCNYYLDVDTSEMVIETISEYLARVISGHRSAGAEVVILLPKIGYSSLGRYDLEDYETALANFDIRYYTFVGGMEDSEFVQVNVNTTNSVMGDGYVGSEIQLLNDEDAPGPMKYYGTDINELKGYHEFTPVHDPVTIALESAGIASIDENQVLTINPTQGGHNPVTIAVGSETRGSIDANQVLTLNNQTSNVGSGDGMDFAPGDDVTLGLPSTISSSTVNEVTATSHTHELGNVTTDDVIGGVPIEYGALYNWHAANDVRGFVSGWHVPSREELIELVQYASTSYTSNNLNNAGLKLNENSSTYWSYLPLGRNNELLFNGRGAGYRSGTGSFGSFKSELHLSTTTDGGNGCGSYPDGCTIISVFGGYADDRVQASAYQRKNAGKSIRLLCDSTTDPGYVDIDGKRYNTVKINDQVWMAENLNARRYANGDWIHGYDGGEYTPISNVDWEALTTEAMCYYSDNEAYGGGETPLSGTLTDLQDQIDNIHPPVTIHATSSTRATIDANQVLTIFPQSNGVIYYLHEEISDIPTYEQALPVPAEDIENEDTAVVTSVSGEVLLGKYITSINDPNTIILPSGAWTFSTYAKADFIDTITEMVIRVYKRDLGGIETELFNTSFIVDSVIVKQYDSISVQSEINILNTDRIVFKYYAKTNSVAARTVYFYYEGSAHYSHIITPIVQISDHNPVTIDPVSSALASIDENQVLTISLQTGLISDTAYDATSWNGVIDVAPSKNAVRDKIESLISGIPAAYVLPTATPSILGGIKIGDGLTIISGVASVTTNYLALTDTIDETYTSKAWYVPRVADTEDNLVLTETVELQTITARLTLMSDFPTSYVGYGNCLLMVKSTEDGVQFSGTLEVYADNATALGGGLVPGNVYRTSDGTIKIVY